MQIDKKLLERTVHLGMISIELVASVGGGALLGKVMDRILKTSPAFLFIFSLCGLIYSTWRIIHYGTSRL